eukprot:jgi/Mesvir1/16922/Mv15783-RA.1
MEDKDTENAGPGFDLPTTSFVSGVPSPEPDSTAADAPPSSSLPLAFRAALGNIPSLSDFPGIKHVPPGKSETSPGPSKPLAPEPAEPLTVADPTTDSPLHQSTEEDGPPDADSILKALLSKESAHSHAPPHTEPSPKPPSPPSVPLGRLPFLSKPAPDPKEEEQHQKDSIVRLFKAAAFSSFSNPESIPSAPGPPPPAMTFAVSAANAALASLKAASSGGVTEVDQDAPAVTSAVSASRTVPSFSTRTSEVTPNPFANPRPTPASEQPPIATPSSSAAFTTPATTYRPTASGVPAQDWRAGTSSSPSLAGVLASSFASALTQLVHQPSDPAPKGVAVTSAFSSAPHHHPGVLASQSDGEMSAESAQLADLHVMLQREALLDAWVPLLTLGVHSRLDLCYVEPADVDGMPLTDDLKGRLWSLVERQQAEMPLEGADDSSGGYNNTNSYNKAGGDYGGGDDDDDDDDGDDDDAVGPVTSIAGGYLSGLFSRLGSSGRSKPAGPPSGHAESTHWVADDVHIPETAPMQGGVGAFAPQVSPGDSHVSSDAAAGMPSYGGGAAVSAYGGDHGADASFSDAAGKGSTPPTKGQVDPLAERSPWAGASRVPTAESAEVPGAVSGSSVERQGPQEDADDGRDDEDVEKALAFASINDSLAQLNAMLSNRDNALWMGSSDTTPVAPSAPSAGASPARGSGIPASATPVSASPFMSAIAGLAAASGPSTLAGVTGGTGLGDGVKAAGTVPTVVAAAGPGVPAVSSTPSVVHPGAGGADDPGVAGAEPPPLDLSHPGLDDSAGAASVADAIRNIRRLLPSAGLSTAAAAAGTPVADSPAQVARSPATVTAASVASPSVSSAEAIAAAAAVSASISAAPGIGVARPMGLAALRGRSVDVRAYSWGSNAHGSATASATGSTAVAAAPAVPSVAAKQPKKPMAAPVVPGGTAPEHPHQGAVHKPTEAVAGASSVAADESGLPDAWLGLGSDARATAATAQQGGAAPAVARVPPQEEDDEEDDALWGLVDTLAAQVDRLAMSIGLVEKEFRGRIASTMPVGKAQQTMLALEIYVRAAPMGSAGSLCVEGGTSAKRTGASSAKNVASTMKDIYKRLKQQHPYVPSLIASWTLIHANPSLVDNSEAELRQLQAEINQATAAATPAVGPAQTAAFYTGAMQALGLRLLAEGQERQLAATGLQSVTEGGRQEEWRSHWVDGGDHDILGVELEYQYGMCLLLLGGRLAEVRRWLGKAAMEGHAEAACAMGQLFDAGNPVSGAAPGLTMPPPGGRPESKDTSPEDLEAVNWWQMAAKHGSLVAMNQLGLCFLVGRGGLRRDRTEAIKWFRRATAGGVADAMNHMGKVVQEGVRGKGEREDIAAAVPWYRQAAERGHVEAMRNLGMCYLKEEQEDARQRREGSIKHNGQYAPSTRTPVPEHSTHDVTFGDTISAHGWLVRAAELGDVDAMLLVAQCWAKGEGGVEKDDETAVKWYRRAAEAGNVVAAAELGTCIHKGCGIYQDPHEAVHWLQAALYGGHMGAGYLLGLYHMGGVGHEPEWEARLGVVEHDIPKGVSLLVAAAQGSYGDVTREACLALARVYTDGAYRKEAKQGGVVARLGDISLLGRRDTPLADVPPKPEEAFKWRLKAAELGDAESQYTVGSTYLKGTLWLPRDGSTALIWLWKAADQGLANAQFVLGRCLLDGVGVEAANEALGMAWFDKAALQGHGESVYAMGNVLLTKVEAMGTPEIVGGITMSNMRQPPRALDEASGLPSGVANDERARLGQEAMQLLRRAAGKDVAEASFRLGCLYEDGLPGVMDKDPLAAVQWYWKASREGVNGCVDAYCKLGLCYLRGIGVDKDEMQARDWLELAVENGHAEACYVLGKLLQPVATSLDEKERVFLLLKQAVDKGYVKDILSLARCYVEGQGVPVNKQKGVELLRDAATGGNPAAMKQLAMCFESGGAGLTKDVIKASYWWALAAEHGDALACYRVGRAILDNEWGPEISESLGGYERAVQALHEAAGLGHVEALFRLGKDMLDKADRPGPGEPSSALSSDIQKRKAARLERERKALEVLKTASMLGSTYATAELGLIYEQGGVGGEERDDAQAVQLFLQATEGVDDDNCNPEALMRLALCFQEGRGIGKDDEAAWRLLNRAAGRNHAEALFHVGQALQVVDLTADDTALEEARQGKAMVERSCELGFLPAMAVIGREMWREHVGGPNTAAMEKGLALIKEAAKGGVVEAVVELAGIYETGAPGHPADLRISFQLWKQAADAGHVKGYLKSGVFVLEAKGGAEQLATATEAYEWLERAVAGYDVEAMHTLAYYYLLEARGMRDMFEREKKEVQAMKLLETAVAANHAPAIIALADIFLQGDIAGQEVDEAAAAALLVRVTPGPSFAESRLRLAKLFMAGKGVEEDRVKGWQLYVEAAEAGSAEACYVVALSLDRGLVDDNFGMGPPTTASAKACLLLPSGKGVQPTAEEQEQSLDLLEISAALNYPPAKAMLGRWLWRGHGKRSDPARGLALLRQAAQAGDLDGMVDLVKCYEEGGPSLKPDMEAALAWLKKASDAGHADSMFQLAQAILDSKPSAHKFGDAATALALIQGAAGHNHAGALLQLAYVMFNDAEKVEDAIAREASEFQALTLLERAARLKNVQAMFDLAEIKRKGGVGGQLADPAESARLLQELLSSHTDYRRGEARVRLAGMFEEGLGVARDEGKALELYATAAEQDRHPQACYVVGCKLARGMRVPGLTGTAGLAWSGSNGGMLARSGSGSVGIARSGSGGAGIDTRDTGGQGIAEEVAMQQRAFEFFSESAQQGYRPAKATLGRCYWEGKGVAQDTQKGLQLVQEAALDGECGAMVTLARWHEEGAMGIVSDIRRAISWWKLAAEEGDGHAQHKVGRFILEKAPGSEELGDTQTALTWLRKAVDQGHLQAKHWLGLGQLLTLGWDTETGTWAPIQPDLAAVPAASEKKPAEGGPAQGGAGQAGSQTSMGLGTWALFGSKTSKEPDSNASDAVALAAAEKERARLQHLYAARADASIAPIDLIESAARAGYEPAIVEMAKLSLAREQLAKGPGADKDPNALAAAAGKAGEWLRILALRDPRPGVEAFSADAKFRLAELCSKGLGMPQDEAKALELYFAAASMGHVGACLKVGALMAAGQVRTVTDDSGNEAGGVDEEGAFAMFRAAADNGSREGKVEVARRLWAGQGAAQDPPAAIGMLRPLAGAGFAEAQRELASCLLDGAPGVKASPLEAREWLTKAAASGDAPAQLKLGIVLLSEPDEGDVPAGCKSNAETGLALIYTAAKAELPAAQVQMGRCLELGLTNKPADIRAALAWYTLAAEKGDWDGMVSLGLAYLRLAREGTRGAGTEAKRGESMDEGLTWLRKAATLGCVEAVYQLGIVAESGADSGLPIKRNAGKAIELYLEAARGGHTKAQLALGVRYLQGGGEAGGIARKVSDGLRWLKQAAMVGNDAEAQFQLGKLYSQGVPGELERDPAIAVQWLRRSANQDHPPAQNGLGEAYQNGVVVIQDDASAVTWFRRAAEKEYPPALLNLARCLESGRGCKADFMAFLRCLETAANLEYPQAQYEYAMCYRLGKGMKKDVVKAMELLRKAAATGHVSAMHQLGLCLRSGEGLPAPQMEQAKEWLMKAAAGGSVQAQTSLDEVIAEQIKDAKAKAQNAWL